MDKDQQRAKMVDALCMAGAVAGSVGDWLRVQQLLWTLGVRPEFWNAAGTAGVEGPRRVEVRP